MTRDVSEERVKDLMRTVFPMSGAAADGWWLEFSERVERETAAWVAFASCMAGLGSRITRPLKVHA
jgi:hypothetical protein